MAGYNIADHGAAHCNANAVFPGLGNLHRRRALTGTDGRPYRGGFPALNRGIGETG